MDTYIYIHTYIYVDICTAKERVRKDKPHRCCPTLHVQPSTGGPTAFRFWRRGAERVVLDPPEIRSTRAGFPIRETFLLGGWDGPGALGTLWPSEAHSFALGPPYPTGREAVLGFGNYVSGVRVYGDCAPPRTITLNLRCGRFLRGAALASALCNVVATKEFTRIPQGHTEVVSKRSRG